MVRVLQRSLAVLEAFEVESPQLSLHEISKRVSLPKSTTFRILTTLVNAGYLIHLENQEYCLSYKIMRLASVARQSIGIFQIVHPMLVRLSEQTGETVEVSRRDGDSRICIDVVESASPLKSIITPGDRLPLLFGATGKVFLASMPPEELAELIGLSGLKQTRQQALKKEITVIRAQGYAITRDERVVGATAVAVPFWHQGSTHEYTLTVTGPAIRFEGREEKIRDLVLKAAEALSSRLAGVSPPAAASSRKAG